MKKILVITALTLLVAAPAMSATIKGSKHDLSNAVSNWGNDYDRICALCHTPHEASTTALNAPLWNRTYDPTVVTNIYNAVSTTNAVFDLASYRATDAPLCLSCHDGSSMTDALVNPPNNGDTGVQFNITGDANLGGDLGNDHPIGFNYAAVQTIEGAAGLHASPGLVFYDGIMWCSTCHDVHDPANTPFLAAPNDQSALCLTCHNK